VYHFAIDNDTNYFIIKIEKFTTQKIVSPTKKLRFRSLNIHHFLM